MRAARKPRNELERLETLRRFQVLDTRSEASFDDITFLAASICGTPIALVSLIDQDRQWFKSRYGLDATETPRDVSFCGHSILGTEIFEVEDAFQDARFSDNPLVTGNPHVRFYAGAPLVSSQGHAVGTLCVIDHSPKTLSPDQKRSLQALARHVMTLLELRVSHKGIREAHSSLETLFEHMTEGLLIYDHNRKIIRHNLRALEILGISESSTEQLDSLDFKFIDANGLPLPQDQFPAFIALKTKKSSMDTLIGFASSDAPVRWLKVSAVPVSGSTDSEQLQVIFTFRDVSEEQSQRAYLAIVRNDLEENKKFLNNVLNSLPDLIAYMDSDLRYLYANVAYEKWFGLSMEKVLGQKITEVIGESAFEMAKPYLDRALAGEKVMFESTVPYKYGGTREIQVSYIPDQRANKNAFGIIVVVRDVTAANRANEAALAAAKSKSEFLANISHEIRTPMNGVIGMCNLMLGDELSSSQIERLKIILNCGNSLLDLINDVLDFSKLEADKVELETEPFDVIQTTQEIVELFRGQAAEKKVALSFSADKSLPVWILGDSTRFRQILTNLVSNAVKFTENGDVRIQANAEHLSNAQYRVQFSVTDTGIGIPDNLKNKLFNSFSQVDASTTRKYGGTGLGLAICKGLCERMGGTIGVESRSGFGSTFSFDFLASETHSREVEAKPHDLTKFDVSMAERTPLCILVVEDNRTNQLVTLGFLERLGYRADVAANGKEAVEICEQKNYDLIFMDCHMPVMDGFEATRIIRERHPEHPPKIVALTASTTQADINHCRAMGMEGFIGKPVTTQNLLEQLRLFDRRKQEPTAPPEAKESVQSSSFDRKSFLENFSGLEDVACEAIQVFLDTVPRQMKAIESAFSNKNVAEIELTAHALKGALATFYAEPAKILAWKLEQVAHADSLENFQNYFQDLDSELQVLTRDLVSFLNETGGSS